MSHPSTLRLHQLRLGELGPTDEDALRSHLAGCPACAARLDHQRELRAEFVRMPMPEALQPKPSLWERLGHWRMSFVALPVAAALAVAVLPLPDEGTRSKGGDAALEAWVETGRSARPAYTNELVAPGSRVQLKFDARGHRYVTLAGRDGAGVVEVYSTLQAQGGVEAAPFSLTLDDTPGDQIFFAVLTDARPDPERLVEGLAEDPVRVKGAEIAQVTLRKE